MPLYDFSSGFNLLNQGINSLGEALNNRTNAQGYSGIGQDIQNNDYRSAAARAWAMGNPDLALKLQGMAYGMSGGGYQPLSTDASAPASLTSPTQPTDATKPAAPGAVTAGPSTGTSGPRAGGALTANPFTNTLIRQESSGQNIVSNTDADSHGLMLKDGGNRNEISQGFFQIQNYPGGTWTIYAPKAGVDLKQYPTPVSAPFAVQHAVAQQIPIGQWGGETKKILAQKFGPLDPKMTLGQLEAKFGPVADVTLAQPGAAAPAAPAAVPPVAPAAPTAAAAPAAAAGPQAAATPPPATPAQPRLAQAQPLPPPAPLAPAAAMAQGPARPAAPAGGGFSLASLLGISPASAGELQPGSGQPSQPPPAGPPPAQGAPGSPIGNAITGAIGNILPQTPQPPPRIPGAYGQMPNPQAPPTNAMATTNIAPSTYGGAGTPAQQLQPIIQALQSGRLTMRDLLANPQGFGLPDPRQPAAQPVWAALARVATGGGPSAGAQPPVTALQQGPPAPAPGPGDRIPPAFGAPPPGGLQPAGAPGAPAGYFDRLRQQTPPIMPQGPFSGATPTAAPGGGFPFPSPFAGATTTAAAPGRPRPLAMTIDSGARGPGFGEGTDPTSAIAAQTGAGFDWSGGIKRLRQWPAGFAGANATAASGKANMPQEETEEAPLPPVRPADIGKPFPVPAELNPEQKPPPVQTQPKSSRVPTPQGPYGPPEGLSKEALGMIQPGAGQMWGPSGGAMASGRGGITPDYLGGPTPQGVTPAAIAAAQNAFRQGPGGTVPAALPPGAPTRGGGGLGGALGGALSGLGGGLLNMLSATPPQGVPGLNTPVQFLQGGQNAPVPAPPWLRQQQPGAAVLPTGGQQPTIQGPTTAQPAAAPGAPGQPAAQPSGPVAAIDAQIAQTTQMMQLRRMQASQIAYFNPAQSKILEDEANKFQEQINQLQLKKADALIKTGTGDQGGGGEVGAQTRADDAKEAFKQINDASAKIRLPGGPLGLLRSVTAMRQDLANTDLTGKGAAQPLFDKLATAIALVDPATSQHLASAQEFDAWKGQELAQLATTLYAQGGGRILKQEFDSLRQHNYDRSFRPEAIKAMLDGAEARGNMALDAYNTQIDNYPKIHKGFYSADDLAPMKVTQKERDAAVAGAPSAPTVAPENQTMTNPQTGQKIIKRNGQWQPLQ